MPATQERLLASGHIFRHSAARRWTVYRSLQVDLISAIKCFNRFDDVVHLRSGQIRVHRQGEDF